MRKLWAAPGYRWRARPGVAGAVHGLCCCPQHRAAKLVPGEQRQGAAGARHPSGAGEGEHEARRVCSLGLTIGSGAIESNKPRSAVDSSTSRGQARRRLAKTASCGWGLPTACAAAHSGDDDGELFCREKKRNLSCYVARSAARNNAVKRVGGAAAEMARGDKQEAPLDPARELLGFAAERKRADCPPCHDETLACTAATCACRSSAIREEA